MFRNLTCSLLLASGLLLAASPAWSQCFSDTTHLCLNGDRFRVSVDWQTATASGSGHAVALTSDTGYFWFFDSTNVELLVKVLDACSLNGAYWVFAGGLTDVATTWRVEDTATGTTRTYRNPQGTPFAPVQDTAALRTCPGHATAPPSAQTSRIAATTAEAAREVASRVAAAGRPDSGVAPLTYGGDEGPAAPHPGKAACAAGATALCLNGGRFQVSADWQAGDGTRGSGHAVALTSDTGYFWFFSPANVEMVVKLLNGCPLNQRFWVFAGGLTDVQVTLRVQDTENGTVKTYVNPQGNAFRPLQDTNAFATCSGAAPLPLKDHTVLPLPELSINPPRPAGGGAATVLVDSPGAGAIQLTATGDGCGAIASQSTSGARLTQTQAVGSFGRCDLVARVTGGSQTRTLRSSFTVEPIELDLPAVAVESGLFLPGDLPAATGEPNAPNIQNVVAPGTLINGGTAQLRIALDDPSLAANVNRVLIQVPTATGFGGHYEVPAARDGSTLLADLRLDPDFPNATSARDARRFASQRSKLKSTFSVLVQLVDFLGRIGRQFLIPFNVQEVGSGNVQISLSWDTPTDVDLHVVEPAAGEEIYYGNRQSGVTGGTLDLDSNPACSIDGVNNENITWPSGSPLAGEHIVRVDYWEACGGLPANYTVTTKVCGNVQVFRGSFSPLDADTGGLGAGREITRFTPSCDTRVRGKATYEDRAQTADGLAATKTNLPIRFAQVEVKRASDDATLAEGSTKQDGTFDIRFRNSGTPGYYVVVMAQQDDEFVKQAVKNDQDKIYAVRSSGTTLETQQPDRTDLDITAKESEAGPAFNVFDMGVVGASLYRQRHGVTPPFLNWLWTSGKPGACRGGSGEVLLVSCYIRAENKISVLSDPTDRDEYDDLVLLHEFGHKWQAEQSRVEQVGGSHSIEDRINPTLAWKEGGATYFGNTAKGTSLYLDTNPTGVGVKFDIESLNSTIPLGTSDGTQSGNLSEAVVAAIFWDLADSENETKDTLSNPDAVFQAFSSLHGSGRDRGVTGADLVDFLDGWFCKGNGSRGDATSGVQGIVTGIHKFPYDFATQQPCP